jgi:enamine deaminase RidA (YjgF/YER057c/UK114 family)
MKEANKYIEVLCFEKETMKKLHTKSFESERVISKVSYFHPNEGTLEAHLIVEAKPLWSTLKSWQFVQEEVGRIIKKLGYSGNSPLFMRVFLSDALNQELILRKNVPELFDDKNKACISFVQQPPLSGAKLAVWVYLVKGDLAVEHTEFGSLFRSNGLTHIYTSNLMGAETLCTFDQTKEMFLKYIKVLDHFKLNMLDNTVRTWIFARDVDTIYMDIVRARKLIFEEQGLTTQTHYLASTGIEGRNEKPNLFTFMDAYCIAGIKPEQIHYLKAPTHMCPTQKYGVTFERGTEIHYGDRKHVFISGTASIDNQGEILYSEDVEKQTQRVVENIAVLLDEAGSNLTDLVYALVYIRDIADYSLVKIQIEKLLPEIPSVILLAPVCRPGWLVEIEGMAIADAEGMNEFDDF